MASTDIHPDDPVVGSDVETEGPSRRTVLVGVTAVVLVIVLVVGAWWWIFVRPPYGPDAMAPRATVEVVDAETERAALTTLAGAAGADKVFLAVEPGRHLLVGQVSFTVPKGASAKGRLALLVIHKPTNSVAPTLFGVGPRPEQVNSGWDGRLAKAGHEYDWLSAIGTGQAESELTAPGDAILTQPDTPGPITFVAQLRPDITQLNADDFLVALVFIGPHDQLYWAQRLAG